MVIASAKSKKRMTLMMNSFKARLLLALIVAAFLTLSAMDYSDEIIMHQYCEKMKADGAYPAGYKCE